MKVQLLDRLLQMKIDMCLPYQRCQAQVVIISKVSVMEGLLDGSERRAEILMLQRKQPGELVGLRSIACH